MKGDELRAKWNGLSEEIMGGIAGWREQHPQATFREMEAEIDKRLWELRAKMITDPAMASAQAGWKTGTSGVSPAPSDIPVSPIKSLTCPWTRIV